VEGAHDVGQFAEGEANFGAGGEVVEAKVDGVGAGFDGGVQLGPVPGRTHDFGFVIGHGEILHYFGCNRVDGNF